MKLKKIESNVHAILLKYPESRSNDFILYALYIEETRTDLRNVELIYALKNSESLKLPSYESVTRTRRKLQSEFPKLKPPAKVKAIRDKKEKQYIQYARKKTS